MTLQNLARIGRLNLHSATPEEVQRNLNDYTGAPLEQGAADEAIAQAKSLLSLLETWLNKSHPTLLVGAG
ncbi:MAG TPA: hypothetical protein VFR86_14760 [Burkholderiaceae bacterium]|nr:hypothetical protein [Burkholderiaceae bacterium]